jgi:fluoride exporter
VDTALGGVRLSSKIYNLIAIATGGAAGTLLRYNLNVKVFFSALSYATLTENLLGSFLLGCFVGWVFHVVIPEWLKLGLSVGLLGGFTTMSTFAADTFSLYTLHSVFDALTYVSVSFFGGVVMAFLGFLIGNRLGFFTSRSKWEDIIR